MRYFILFEEFDEAKGLSKKHKIEVPQLVFKDTLQKFPAAVEEGFTK